VLNMARQMDKEGFGNCTATGSCEAVCPKEISLDSIADSVGLPKSGERFRWVRSYFEAKARQFASAGYPVDVGGLLASAASHRQPPIA